MPPKSKRTKIEVASVSSKEESSYGEEEDTNDLDDEEYTDDESDEYSDDEDEDNSNDESEFEEEEEEEKSKEDEPPKPTPAIPDLIENEKTKMVSMNYCSKHLYKGQIENIEGILDDSVIGDIEIEEEAPLDNKPAFENVNQKWGWEQEVILLEGVQTHGLFDWPQIAENLSKSSRKKFKAEEAEKHYYQYYCNGTLGQVWNYRLEEKPLECEDHTDPHVVSSTKKYLPSVKPVDLRGIKFLPHREDFDEFPPSEVEKMVTKVDFSAFYMNNLKALKIDQEVKNLQLVIVDAYRQVIADRMKMYHFMKDFKLIEQFFNRKKITQKCELEKFFCGLQKFVCFFDSPHEFIKFFFDCVKEKLLKLEIARLYQELVTEKKKERDPEMKVLLRKRAPGCYSMLTKILYCKGPKRERNNSSSLGEKERDEILICAHPTLLEGIRLRTSGIDWEKCDT